MSRPDEPRVDGGQQAVPYWLDYLFERDYLVHAVVHIDVPHHYIHGGQYWSMGTRIPSLNGSLLYLIRGVGDKNFHFFHHLNTNGAARVLLYQDPTITNAGTLLANPPWMNHKQGEIGTPSSLEVYQLPIIANPGTIRPALSFESGGTGVGGSSTSGAARNVDEIIVEADKYWLAVIDTDSDQIANYVVSGYEK